MNGYGNGKFGFGDHITRGQVTSLIARYLGLTANNEQAICLTILKIICSKRDIKAIAQAGIMTGDGTGAFRPDDALTQGEMAVVLQKSISITITKYKNNFKDVPQDH